MRTARRSHLMVVPSDWDEQAHQAQEALAAGEPGELCDHPDALTVVKVECGECGLELWRDAK